MERLALRQLINWKERADKKPLIIQGARQVGKTWLMKEFGRKYYDNVAYIMFEKNNRMKELFSYGMDVHRLLSGIEVESNQKISPCTSLIIFDEIQACPDALTALKFFYEDIPEYNIVAAGSLLGASLHENISFPVGKVEFMTLYPMNFYEFLLALNEKGLCGLLDRGDFGLISAFKNKFISYLRMYFYVGGMPEAVLKFSNGNDFTAARNVQNQILESYMQDFSKHIPAITIPKVRQIWNSIPAQLAKENKKFIYNEVQKGGRAKDYETALEWLIHCGLIYRVARISKPAIPLKSYDNTGIFKLFLVDVGLLSAMSLLEVRTLLEGDKLFTEFKGALTEQFVFQEIKAMKCKDIAYWANEGSRTAEVDFVVQTKNYGIVPLEVKSSTNLKAKSLKVYIEKFSPVMVIRSSLSDFNYNDNFYDIPLYALNGLEEIITS
jgi:predicted AAA+ superfamily ATPase